MNNRRFLKQWLKISLIVLIVISALLFAIVELSAPWISQYRAKIEQYATAQLGQPVTIGEVTTGLHYLEPVVQLSDIAIHDNQEHTIVHIGKINVGLSWFSSLFHWKLEPGNLIISQIDFHQKSSWLNVSQTNNPITTDTLEQVFSNILVFKKIILKDLDVYWKNETTNGFSSFKVVDAYVRIRRKIGGFYVKAEWDWYNQLQEETETPMHVSTGINFSDGLLTSQINGDGTFYLNIEHLNFPEIQQRIQSIPGLSTNELLSRLIFQQGLGDIQLHGDLKKEAQAWSISQWTLSADVQNLNWMANQDSNMPSVSGVSGTLFMQPEQGTLHLNTSNLSINYPALFSHVLPFSNTNIQFQWEKDNETWSFDTQNFIIENPQISADANCHLEWTNGLSDAFIQLRAPFTIHDVAGIRQYLPDNIMNPKLRAWLHRSLVGGIVTGTMVLNGKLTDYPFDSPHHHEGIFLVDSDFRQFSLDFKDKWPVAKNMNAHIIFKNRDLIADINDGMLDQLPLTDIKAQIPALGLGTETLKIEGHLKADASHARHFILNSPIEEKLSSFNNLLLSGPGIFDVDIQIPLYAKNNINLVNGKVMFLDNTLTLEKWWNTNIQHFKGNLSYNQNGVISSQLDGKFFNYPLHLTMKSVVKPTSATVVDINAQLGIDALRQMFPIFIFDFLKGATTCHSQLILTSSKTKEDQLILKSSLKGISVNLPPPFAKKAQEQRPLTLKLLFSDSDNQKESSDTKLSIDWDKMLSLYLGYYASYSNSGKKQYVFHHGNVVLGDEKATKPSKEGLGIKIKLSEFSLPAWKSFFDAIQHQKAQKNVKQSNSNSPLQFFELSTPLLKTGYQDLHNASVILQPQQDIFSFQIKSDEVAGNVKIPFALNSGIVARLDYVRLKALDAGAEKGSSSLKPLDIPPLDVQINDFRYKKLNLGKIQLVTRSNVANNALVINRFNFSGPATNARFQGVWKWDNNQSITQIRGTLSSSNLRQTLTNLDISPVVYGAGELNMDLHWAAMPTQFDSSILNGSASLAINNGSITHLSKSMQEKVGMGKLLNLFSLQSLAQHLTLNFSDVSTRGLTFKTLKGNFALKQGRMSTRDTSLEGPIADITMQGDIDMGKKLYNLILNITPMVSSSGIPVIATIAGGPVLGLAALAATALIHQGVKQTSYRYKVIGPWSNPTVKSY